MSSEAAAHRLLEVPPERLVRWVLGFRERHGEVSLTVEDPCVRLRAADGAVAELEVPWPPVPALDSPVPAVLEQVVTALSAHAAAPRLALLALVRRGGYGAGTARDGKLLSHAVGTRYVQGRTAAGGWSQHRFARRRSGQAAALAGSASDAVHKILSTTPERPQVLVVGGDRGLVEEVLRDPRLARLAALPRSPLMAVPDPRLGVLTDVARRCRAVRVRLDEPRP